MLKSTGAGTWYEAQPKVLEKEIHHFLHESKQVSQTDIMALIVPHAGYQYSGRTAGYAFQAVEGHHYERVIVIGPSHRVYLKSKMVVPEAEEYATPLGKIPIDRDFIDNLKKNKFFTENDQSFIAEHSVDNEVPFIQAVVKDFKIVPIIMGNFNYEELKTVAQFFRPLIDEKTLIVISSDFNHVGTSFDFAPFHDHFKENLFKLDHEAAQFILTNDSFGFYSYVQKTGSTICGFLPITFLLELLPSTARAKILNYQTSGDITGDYNQTVSYFALGVTGSWKDKKSTGEFIMNDSDKTTLLKYSRQVLEEYINNKKKIQPKDTKFQFNDLTKNIAGGFVTLTKKGELRGCIGEIFPSRDVASVVREHTINAAVNDPRFPPVKKEELADIEIEISILTPPEPVSGYKDIVIGKHGILLNKQGRSAVFLPQVAPEQGWDLQTTLEYLAMKAGLSKNDWREGAQFQVFEAIVFHETKIKKH